MKTEKLFSYGTLRLESVQIGNFGRKLTGESATLPGFSLSHVSIQDPNVVNLSGEAVHPIITPTGNHADEVKGMVFELSYEELLKADSYEVDDYKRIKAPLASGEQVWVYVAKGFPNRSDI
ncbi:AIG2-like family [Legionella adelaidensis]|uniref:AIG2-like family n=1 Tax=Legionella adelaidensis TaxID=45056 RepID=A0A0W0R6G5_9GAMM|nr:gamma-glutamylcyclotransferase family protein [Legionella adelaidensis]KTC66637.1 AIG2-like family protein [Legionella adelaidensis]VEH81016.1 AIG2-like family [Legionella adelaidensis]